MKFNERVEEILESGSEIRSLNKLIAKLSDPQFYEEAMFHLREDFEKNFENDSNDGFDWEVDAVKEAIKAIDKKYNLDKRDSKLLTDILQSEAYNMMTRG